MNMPSLKSNTRSLKLTTRGHREIVMTRVFDAPRTLVWDAFTKPELLKRWLYGPPEWSLAECEMGTKPGERYHYLWQGPNGEKMGAGGVVREVIPPERMVMTERFDDPWYPGEMIGTIELTERDGKTTLTQTLVYESREARDMVLKTPMEDGIGMSYDRLADVLATVAHERAS
jgi:uncharacterized protein YndB with AHSA1/START domain